MSSRLLLVGKDWQARALLRAQLIEDGLDVEAHESVAEAVESLESAPALPALLLADLSASDQPAAEAEQLAAWAKELPIWVVASKTVILDRSLKGRGFEMIFYRPVDMEELIAQIKRRMGAAP